jgi:hypothetical protein
MQERHSIEVVDETLLMVQNGRTTSELLFSRGQNKDLSTQAPEELKWISAFDTRFHHVKAGSGRRNPSDHSNKRTHQIRSLEALREKQNIHLAKWSTQLYDPE